MQFHLLSKGIVETFNQTMLNNLSFMVPKNHQNWNLKLLLFLLVYFSDVSKSAGYISSQMLFDS